MIAMDQFLKDRSTISGTSEELEMLQHAIECREIGLAYRSQFEADWLRAFKLYNRIHRAGQTIPGRSNLYIPYVYATIETILPELILSFFASEHLVRIMARNPQFQDNADSQQIMFDKTVEDARVFCKKELALRDCLTLGDTIVKVPIDVDFRTGRAVPGFYPQDNFDMVLDPDNTDIQKSHFVILRDEKSFYELKYMESVGAIENVDALRDLPKMNPMSKSRGFIQRMQALGKTGTIKHAVPKYEVWEGWIGDRVFTWVGDKVILRNTNNPFVHQKRPFFKYSYTPQSRRVWNDGVAILIENLQEEINKYRTARLDNVLLTLNKGVIVDRSMRINSADLLIRPGMQVRSDDVNGVKTLDFGNVDSSAFMEDKELERSIQLTTGVWDYLSGSTPRHEETATGIIRLQEAARSRIALMINRVQKEALPEFAEMVCKLNQQFAEPETTIPMVQGSDGSYQFDQFGLGRATNNVNFRSIFREELMGDFTFDYTARPEDLDINTKRNDAITLWNALGNHPVGNPVAFAVDLLKSFGRHDVQKYINPQFLQAMQVQSQTMGEPGNPIGQLMAAQLAPGNAPRGMLGPGGQGNMNIDMLQKLLSMVQGGGQM